MGEESTLTKGKEYTRAVPHRTAYKTTFLVFQPTTNDHARAHSPEERVRHHTVVGRGQ